MSKIVVITGQTATGKTKYALDLASKINGELINFDSRQVYKKLDIITGKDIDKTDQLFELYQQIGAFDIGTYTFEKTQIPIWLYDIVSPKLPFSSFNYRECAIRVITNILSRNKSAILVGGTYFYIKHLLYGTVETLVEPDTKLRAELNKKTTSELQNILQKLDSELFDSLNNSEKNNPHRLIRKIEIIRNKNVILSKAKNPESNRLDPSVSPQDDRKLNNVFPDVEINMIGFEHKSKEILQSVITKRVENRLELGAIQEVESLLQLGNSASDPGLKTIGYVQVIDYLQKKMSYEEMKQIWITKEVQYAKRQLTFMKKDANILWKTSEGK